MLQHGAWEIDEVPTNDVLKIVEVSDIKAPNKISETNQFEENTVLKNSMTGIINDQDNLTRAGNIEKKSW